MRNLHLGLYTPNQEVPKHSGSLFHSTRATTEKKKILEEEFGKSVTESLTGILKEDDLDARKAKRLKEKYETA